MQKIFQHAAAKSIASHEGDYAAVIDTWHAKDASGVLDPAFAAELADISVSDLSALVSFEPDNPSTLFDAVSISDDLSHILSALAPETGDPNWTTALRDGLLNLGAEDVHATGVKVADAAYMPQPSGPF